LSLFVALLMGLSACGDDDEGGGGSGSAAGGDQPKKVNIAHFVVLQANPFEQAHIDEVAKTATKLGADVTVFDANLDPQAQEGQCRDAIATQKFQAFLMKAVAGPTMVSCSKAAIDAGIKVVAVETPLGERMDTLEPQIEGLSGSVLALPAEYAEVTTKITASACEGDDDCRVIHMFGSQQFTVPALHADAFQKAIKADHPNIEVVAEAETHYDPDEAFQKTRQLLQVNKNIDAIVSDADPASIGIWRALGELNLQDKVKLLSDGGTREGVEFVKNGDWFASPPNLPRSMGRRSTEIAVADARGEDPGDTTVSIKKDLGKEFSSGIYTEEQLETFQPEWQLGTG
jgi:ribose transport system substrate-binding protein